MVSEINTCSKVHGIHKFWVQFQIAWVPLYRSSCQYRCLSWSILIFHRKAYAQTSGHFFPSFWWLAPAHKGARVATLAGVFISNFKTNWSDMSCDGSINAQPLYCCASSHRSSAKWNSANSNANNGFRKCLRLEAVWLSNIAHACLNCMVIILLFHIALIHFVIVFPSLGE